jgi:uncharacterized protein
MFLLVVAGDARTGRTQALRRKCTLSLSAVVPSLSEVLHSFTAVILTGGSSGIGKSFIELGEKLVPELVFCNLSRTAPAKYTSAQGRKNLNHFACDLSRAEDLARTATEVGVFLQSAVPSGRILLINNSGFGAFGPFPEPDLPNELQMIDLNVRAVVHLTGLLLPLLRARGGAVMNIASTVAFQPTAYAATYGATKAFVLNWTVALNEELRGTNVRALAVCPGTTRTEFFRRAGAGGAEKAPFAMSTTAVVEIAIRALGRRRAVVVTGWPNRLMTLAGALAPKAWGARVSGAVLRRLRGLERRG